MTKILVVLDIPGIKNYVFSSNVLREIQGASALIDHFSRWETEPLLRDWFAQHCCGNSVSEGSAAVEVEKIFANAGGGQFLVRNSPGEAEVRGALLHVARELRHRSQGGLFLNFGMARVSDEEDGYRKALDQAHLRMRRRRKSAPRTGVAATWPLARECDSLACEPASLLVDMEGVTVGEGAQLSESDPETRWLSMVAYGKLEAARWARGRDEKNLWAEFRRETGKTPAYSLESLGKSARRTGYVGILYADGNSMGKVVRSIPDPASYRAFSDIVDNAIRKSAYTLIKDLTLKAFPLLLGGDDLVMIVAADRALEFAARLPGEFQRRSKDGIAASGTDWLRKRCPDGFSLSIGVAFGRASHPFHLLLHQAEQLLKSAKRDALSEAEPTKKARIDFHLTQSSSTRELQALRRQEWRFTETIPTPGGSRVISCSRTFRPYSPESLRALLDCTQRLREEKLPRNKASAMAEAAWSDSLLQAEILALENIGRLKPKHRKILVDLEKKLRCSETPPFHVIPDSQERRAFAIDLQECLSLQSTAVEEDEDATTDKTPVAAEHGREGGG